MIQTTMNQELPTITVLDGKFDYPIEFRDEKRGIVITQKWVKTAIRGRNIQTWFRHGKHGEKPFLKEDDVIEFKLFKGDTMKYRAVLVTTGDLLNTVFKEKE